jgi:SH3-like domain-containing protein
MKIKAFSVLLGTLLQLTLFAAPCHYVNESVIDVHLAPGHFEEVETQVSYGEVVAVHEKINGWCRVETARGDHGWVAADQLYLRPDHYPATSETAMVTSICAYLYSVPDTTPHPPALGLPYGIRLEVIAQPEENYRRWVQVRLLDGREMWLNRHDLSFEVQTLTLNEMLDLGRQFVGQPYRWAGNTSLGFDCSGLNQFLYLQMGVELPPNSRQQMAMPGAIEVAKEDLEPGDLIFFSGMNGGERVSHCGIYLGEGEFIQAISTSRNTPPTTQISQLDEEQWTFRYRGARRVAHLADNPELAAR